MVEAMFTQVIEFQNYVRERQSIVLFELIEFRLRNGDCDAGALRLRYFFRSAAPEA